MVIYFCYGIQHSTEAALARSSPETEMNGFKRDHDSDAMAAEKEAFLFTRIEARDDDEGDL